MPIIGLLERKALEKFSSESECVRVGLDVGGDMEAVLGGSESNKDLAEGLGVVLADTYLLQLKTQGFHWNVEGPMFYALHQLFGEQYLEMFAAADDIAERMRALGFTAPGRVQEFVALSTLQDGRSATTATEMLGQLVACHEILIKGVRRVLALAEELGDPSTVDLLTQRLSVHEKAAWMLRSLLG